MSGEIELVLQTPFDAFRLRVHRFRAPPADARQLQLRSAALFALRTGLEWGEPDVVRVAFALERALGGGAELSFDAFGGFEPFTAFASPRQLEFLAETLADEFHFGRISVERLVVKQLTDRPDAFQPEIPPLPPPRREDTSTFFDVRFVDEIGQGINGVQVEYEVDGSFRDVTTMLPVSRCSKARRLRRRRCASATSKSSPRS